MRLAAALAYDGTNYAGWQWQPNVPTIQGTVKAAIAQVATHTLTVTSAGRTDQGVHASEQIIHFDTTTERTLDTWRLAINYYLPPSIRILWIQAVDSAFHARASAIRRTYCYKLYQGYLPWFRQYSWTLHRHLNIQAMQTAAIDLIGEHDFSVFRAAQCQAISPIREIQTLKLRQANDWIECTISANAFLHHMVRNIMGVLVEVGQGKREASSMPTLLNSRNRQNAGITAPPQGLYLQHVLYPARFHLPNNGLVTID